jgi:hypothetical protein
MPTTKTVGFYLANIQTEQFAILNKNLAANPELSLNIDINFGLDQQTNRIGCFVNIGYLHQNQLALTIEVKCEFQIEAEAWESFVKPRKKFKIQKRFLQHLAIISVGTTRGILHAKTEKTVYNIYPLPTINVSEKIITDQVFDLD